MGIGYWRLEIGGSGLDEMRAGQESCLRLPKRGKIILKKVGKSIYKAGNRVLEFYSWSSNKRLRSTAPDGIRYFPDSVLFSGVVNHGKPIQNQNC